MWVPVLWIFDKLREVGVFFYLIYSLAKSHFNGLGWSGAGMTVHSVPKPGLSEEIPRVVLDIPETDRGLFVCNFMC